MSKFFFNKLDLIGAYTIENFNVSDMRGEFVKCFEKDIFSEYGIDFHLNETFFSTSAKNVIRGLHFQTSNPQTKIVSIVKGKVWDVVVDLRHGSSTYKGWVGIELSDKNHRAIFVPKGFAHGFISLEDDSIVLYQCDGKYDNNSDTGIVYNDPDLNINWPIEKNCCVISQRDLNLMNISTFERTYVDWLGNAWEQQIV